MEGEKQLNIEFFPRLFIYWPVAYLLNKGNSLVELCNDNAYLKKPVEYSTALTENVRYHLTKQVLEHSELAKKVDTVSCRGLDLVDFISEKSVQIYTQLHVPSKDEIVELAASSKDKAQQYAYDNGKVWVESGKDFVGKTCQSGVDIAKNKMDDTKEYIQKKYSEEYKEHQVVVFTREKVLLPTKSCIEDTVLPRAKIGFEKYAPQTLQQAVDQVANKVVDVYEHDQFPFIGTVTSFMLGVYEAVREIYQQRTATQNKDLKEESKENIKHHIIPEKPVVSDEKDENVPEEVSNDEE